MAANTWDTIFEDLFLFEGMDEEQRKFLRPLFAPCDCESGVVLFNQGDPADDLFVVVEGEVVIRYKPDDAPALDVARIKPGGIFGWSAAFGRGYYTSAAICETACKLLRVKGDDLKTLYEEHPETGILILEHLAAVVSERLQGTHSEVVALLEHAIKNSIKPVGG